MKFDSVSSDVPVDEGYQLLLNEQILDEDLEAVKTIQVCQPSLTLKQLNDALALVDKAMNIFRKDSDKNRSDLVCRGIKAMISCYEDLKKDMEMKSLQNNFGSV
ncbi:hypothetical protein BLA29_013462 [Euroglyphus maynei]|uniref:Uncharacterized protein n=1 Tax=Euroglyphus maynei TaxID=6958 RepID=A0A1Y3ANF2_EURMA|nr:hypothetical protein BLA29_013462 [Euroglyphus maynei]